MTTQRPNWVKDPAMKEYYDHYWGIPVHDERELFRMLVLECFQAGLSWSTVWAKRQAFDDAFAHFDISIMAHMTDQDSQRLMNNAKIIRNRLKIDAVINNAQVLQSFHQKGQTLDHFLWSFVHSQPIQMHVKADTRLPSTTPLAKEISRQMKRDGFKFVGPVTVFSWMCAVGVVNARIE